MIFSSLFNKLWLFCIIWISILITSSICQSFLPLGSFEYYIEKGSDVVDSFFEAETKCSDLNATLAIVNSEAIQEFLVDNISNATGLPYSFYIGLRRNNTVFEWIDGSPLLDGYTNWRPGEPNAGATGPSGGMRQREDCVIIGWRYTHEPALPWRDINCDMWESRFICQRFISTTLIPTTTPLDPITTATSTAFNTILFATTRVNPIIKATSFSSETTSTTTAATTITGSNLSTRATKGDLETTPIATKTINPNTTATIAISEITSIVAATNTITTPPLTNPIINLLATTLIATPSTTLTGFETSELITTKEATSSRIMSLPTTNSAIPDNSSVPGTNLTTSSNDDTKRSQAITDNFHHISRSSNLQSESTSRNLFIAVAVVAGTLCLIAMTGFVVYMRKSRERKETEGCYEVRQEEELTCIRRNVDQSNLEVAMETFNVEGDIITGQRYTTEFGNEYVFNDHLMPNEENAHCDTF